MDSKSLMIGDWVETTAGTCKVRAIKDVHKGHEGIAIFGKDGWALDGYFYPIPLTAEILEKNGFIETDSEAFGGCLCYEHPTYIVNIFWRDSEDTMTAAGTETTIPTLWRMEIFWDYCFYNKQSEHCFYVHELQHALRLCGLTDMADNFKV